MRRVSPFESGPDPSVLADSGEVEDSLVQVFAATALAHPSGLALVPRGGATLQTGASGGIELSAASVEGGEILAIQAPPNKVSPEAGRVLLPVRPPLPMDSFESKTNPFADGLVLEFHHSGTDGAA